MALLGKLLKKGSAEDDPEEDELLDWANTADKEPELTAVEASKGKSKGLGLGRFKKKTVPAEAPADEDDDEPDSPAAALSGQPDDDEQDEDDLDAADEDDEGGPPAVAKPGARKVAGKATAGLEEELGEEDLDEDSDEESDDKGEGTGQLDPDGNASTESLLGIFEEEVIVDQQLETLASSVEEVDAEELVEELRDFMRALESL